MWDHTYAFSELPSEEETLEEIEFITNVLNLNDNATILDLCCGQGRHAVALASIGYSVIGVDSSRTLLNLMEKGNPQDKQYKLWLVEGDMQNIPLRPNSCAAVINLFTSFGFFDDTGV